MTFREIDNQINRINKRLISVSADLGRQSALYNHYAAVVSNAVAKYGLLKVTPHGAYGPETSIRRTKSIMQRDPKELEQIKKALDHTEEMLNRRKLKDEKKRLRDIAEQAKQPLPPKPTIKDYEKIDEIATNASSTLENALDYFYRYADKEDPERIEAEAIAEIKERRKTYSEIYDILDLAKQHYTRTHPGEEIGKRFGLVGDDM